MRLARLLRMRLLLSTVLLAACAAPQRPDLDAAEATPADAGPDLAPPTLLPPDMAAIAGQLHGAFLELECRSEEIEFQFCYPKDLGKRSVTLKFGGTAGKTYDVVLAVWGVMETVKYQGGMLSGEHFYAGGTSGTPDTAEYGLEFAGKTYYLNYQDIGAGEHYTYGIQYESPPIPIPGAATITLFGRDPNDYINTNHMDSKVTDPPPRLREQLRRIMMEPVQAQFVYVEVKSAVAR
jgi:hypothetical protein